MIPPFAFRYTPVGPIQRKQPQVAGKGLSKRSAYWPRHRQGPCGCSVFVGASWWDCSARPSALAGNAYTLARAMQARLAYRCFLRGTPSPVLVSKWRRNRWPAAHRIHTNSTTGHTKIRATGPARARRDPKRPNPTGRQIRDQSQTHSIRSRSD